MPADASGLSRRKLLAAFGAVPLLGAAAVTGAGVRAGVQAARPGARGGSAARCGLCGATDHAMLAVSCPAAPRVI